MGKLNRANSKPSKRKLKREKWINPCHFFIASTDSEENLQLVGEAQNPSKTSKKYFKKNSSPDPKRISKTSRSNAPLTGKNLAEKTDNLKTFWETFLAPHPENFNQLVNKWSSGTRLQTTKPNSRFPSVTAEKRNFQAGRSGEKASDISPISFHFFKEWIEAGGRGYNTMRIIQSLINGCLVIDRDGCRP